MISIDKIEEKPKCFFFFFFNQSDQFLLVICYFKTQTIDVEHYKDKLKGTTFDRIFLYKV